VADIGTGHKPAVMLKRGVAFLLSRSSKSQKESLGKGSGKWSFFSAGKWHFEVDGAGQLGF